MVTTRRGTKTTSGVTNATAHSPDVGVPGRSKKRTAKRTNKGLEATQNDIEGEEPPKKKAKLELPEKTDYKEQQTEKEKEPNNTGQYDSLHRGAHSLIFHTSQALLLSVATFIFSIAPRSNTMKQTLWMTLHVFKCSLFPVRQHQR